ncbi:putative kinase involved in propanediol utilization [Desulfosporosinus acidiphilus SJ4]|uniref:Putative kinase involved in propanediol utilization n=1 Tax=Desulfosporosinus acidiphilus (strain DSM 22704 / JCM 16185 / SJ4) TaxID=646529 RepID=I4D6H2_DESAJ|nr:GHMP kinase [Desulfosporosinus acidiphilus]AFM41396.1 putative kinase involved in propanediol utilization [Desulfosporosinus acidiphilus SJ4]
MNVSVGLARCPGTCGEWVQGAHKGIPFLVDCPIDRFSEIRVTVDLFSNRWELPSQKTKVLQVLNFLKEDLDLPALGGEVEFLQQLPEGKGMASSTADISAAAAALLLALNQNPSSEQLMKLAMRIEPSDSVMFPGITAFDHVQGHNYKILGTTVPAIFLALDWGGSIDTKLFNARPGLSEHYRRFEETIGRAYKLACEGIEQGDLEKLAIAGTMSAQCNLEMNPKPQFKPFLDWVLKNNGLGVVTAHSGTLLAGVFPSSESVERTFHNDLRCEIQRRFNPVYLDFFKSHPGGIIINKLRFAENAG